VEPVEPLDPVGADGDVTAGTELGTVDPGTGVGNESGTGTGAGEVVWGNATVWMTAPEESSSRSVPRTS